MTREELFQGIGLNSASVDLVKSYQMEPEEYDKLRKMFYEDIDAFVKKVKESYAGDSDQFFLYIATRLAEDAYGEFREKGFSDEFYLLNMKDISIWEQDYEKKYGKPGLQQISWIHYSICQKLYRIGRLQFEPCELGKTVEVCGKVYEKGTKMLNVHIPEDGRLDPEECERSYQEAKAFFTARGYEGAGIFTCESWLLSPRLKETLKETSNIIRFQNRFFVYETIYPFRQTEERVFGEIRPDVENYPENTSLQRAVKEQLRKDPSDFGMGIGSFEW